MSTVDLFEECGEKDAALDIAAAKTNNPERIIFSRFVQEMKLNKAILNCLTKKGIAVPTAIQMQGIPAM